MITPEERGGGLFGQGGWRLSCRRLGRTWKRKKREPFKPDFHDLEPRKLMATFVVTNTFDSGVGSLRQAIVNSNGSPGPNTIDFDIPTTDPGYANGVWTITPLTTELPSITVPVLVDGTSQPGYAGTPLIDLDGTSAESGSTGLELAVGSGGSTIQALTINNFNFAGILIESSGNLVQSSYIGTNATGTAPSNQGYGVWIVTGTSANTIGGTTAAARNIISGNGIDGLEIYGNDNFVLGNYIGTDVTGTVAVGNNVRPENLENGGISLDNGASGNTIGGLAATPGTGAGNVISANGYAGISFYEAGTENLVAGNLIGTDASGTVALGNTNDDDGGFGVVVADSPDTIIGEPGGRNVISANGSATESANVQLFGSSGSVVQSNYIGTDITGTVALSLGTPAGVWTGFGSYTIGGQTSKAGTGLGNVISGNATGILCSTGPAGPDAIEGNIIGADPTGTLAEPNGTGIEISSSASDITIGGTASGAGNVISGNTNDGVEITGNSTTGNLVADNFIGTNLAGTAALGNGSAASRSIPTLTATRSAVSRPLPARAPAT